MFSRSSGILLHITSLPSLGGIGDLGPAALRFVDFLAGAGQRYWQVLPINPTDQVYGNCPYSSPSAYAINPLLISPELLVKEGLLRSDELGVFPLPENKDRVNYPVVIEQKERLFRQAYGRFKGGGAEFLNFCEQHSGWLDPFAYFILFKARFKGAIWSDWPAEIRDRDHSILKEFSAKAADEIKFVKFLQFLAFRQWEGLRRYANSKNVALIGDIPIYVNEDSADVWSHPEIFKLNEQKKPVFVAGVPPDYFSATGQRWGNPVYDWPRLKTSGYGWWADRLRHNVALFDSVRIDHFRGLMAYWEIPASEPTAVNGRWAPGPGEDFLAFIQSAFPSTSLIAEDLGVITPDVTAAMVKFHLPGMKVLHFAFGGDPAHPYLPTNYPEHCVVYTGTHDNNTTRGWFRRDAAAHEKEYLQKYLARAIDENNVSSALIETAQGSPAALSIIPMQDILGLDESCRMNVPGTVYGNWEWRLLPDHLHQILAEEIYKGTKSSGRI